MDGVGAFHAEKPKAQATAKRVAKLLDEIARTGAKRAQNTLYPLLVEESVLGFVDEVMALLTKRDTPIDPHLSKYALRLATETRHRGPVKLGLALLGVMRQSAHENVALTLGKHDEFTLFATVALTNMLDEPAAALWALAKCVDGWGRIQIVERLVPTDEPEIQYWLRTEGYKNSIMYEYLAHTAAVHGRLLDGLTAARVTSEELIAASDVIGALITGNGAPAAGIDAYDEAATTCKAYLDRVGRQPPKLRHFLTAQLIRRYVDDDKRAAAERLKNGWNESNLATVRQLLSELLSQTVWRDLVAEGVKSGSDQEFYDASRAADYIGFDTFEFHWQRLVADPASGGKWYEVMRRADVQRIDRIVRLAEKTIPLASIATGPAEDLGLGKGYEAHSCLDFIVQDLGKFPGKGWRLIDASLKSPVVRNRNMALKALEAWGAQAWPVEAVAALTDARNQESTEDVKKRLERILDSREAG